MKIKTSVTIDWEVADENEIDTFEHCLREAVQEFLATQGGMQIMQIRSSKKGN